VFGYVTYSEIVSEATGILGQLTLPLVWVFGTTIALKLLSWGLDVLQLGYLRPGFGFRLWTLGPGRASAVSGAGGGAGGSVPAKKEAPGPVAAAPVPGPAAVKDVRHNVDGSFMDNIEITAGMPPGRDDEWESADTVDYVWDSNHGRWVDGEQYNQPEYGRGPGIQRGKPSGFREYGLDDDDNTISRN